MKQSVQLSEIPIRTREVVQLWKRRKGYYNPDFTLSQAFELLVGISPNYHREGILHGTYNNTIEFDELQIGWDGEHLIDMMVYYIDACVKKRLY